MPVILAKRSKEGLPYTRDNHSKTVGLAKAMARSVMKKHDCLFFD